MAKRIARNKVIACAMLTRCIKANEMLYPTSRDVEEYLVLNCAAEYYSHTAKPDPDEILRLLRRIWDCYVNA